VPPTLAELLRLPPEVGRLISPASLGCSQVTWQVLCRDGALVELRPGFALVAGTTQTSADRAQTLAGSVPQGVVVARRWAVWVHAGGHPPSPGQRICVVFRPGASRPRSTPGLEPVQTSLRPWDVTRIGDLAVTSPGRTAMDVATWSGGADAARDLLRLRDIGTDLLASITRLRRASGWRGALQAIRTIEAASLVGLDAADAVALDIADAVRLDAADAAGAAS
jgi:hypothetical protein